MKKLMQALLLIIFVIVILSMVPAKAAVAPKTIKIGASISFSGTFASGAIEVWDGQQIAADHINKTGGVYVKEFNKKIPLELIALDDGSDPTKTVSNLEVLYARDNVTAYLSGHTSALGAAGAAVGAKNKVPYVGTTMAVMEPHQVGNKYLFVPFPKTYDFARGNFDVIEHLIKREKDPTLGNIAIFTQQTDHGIGQTKEWKNQAEKRKLNIVYEGKYGPNDRDFSSLLMGARSAGAQVLLDTGSLPVTIAEIRQMKELNIFFKWFYTVLGSTKEKTWVESLGTDGDYIAWGMGWDNQLKYPMVKELNESYVAKKGYLPSGQVGPGYSLVQILAAGIERAGTLDRDRIRDAIATINTMTVMGPIQFNPDGTAKNLTYFCDQYQHQKCELVWPSEMATKPIAIALPWNMRK